MPGNGEPEHLTQERDPSKSFKMYVLFFFNSEKQVRAKLIRWLSEDCMSLNAWTEPTEIVSALSGNVQSDCEGNLEGMLFAVIYNHSGWVLGPRSFHLFWRSISVLCVHFLLLAHRRTKCNVITSLCNNSDVRVTYHIWYLDVKPSVF